MEEYNSHDHPVHEKYREIRMPDPPQRHIKTPPRLCNLLTPSFILHTPLRLARPHNVSTVSINPYLDMTESTPPPPSPPPPDTSNGTPAVPSDPSDSTPTANFEPASGPSTEINSGFAGLEEIAAGPEWLQTTFGEVDVLSAHITTTPSHAASDPQGLAGPVLHPMCELRSGPLPTNTTKAPMERAEAELESVNSCRATGKTRKPGDPGYVKTHLFKGYPGQPGRGGASFIDDTCKWRFTAEAYRLGLANWIEMEYLRRGLIMNGLETNWSCATTNDRRAQMIAYFNPVGEAPSLPTDNQAKVAVTEHCTSNGYAIESAWGKLAGASQANARPSIFFKLRRPGHVPFVEALGPWTHDFPIATPSDHSQAASIGQVATWQISVEPYPNQILPLNPATLAMRIADSDDEVVAFEVHSNVDRYVAETGNPTKVILIDYPKPSWVRIVLDNIDAATFLTTQDFRSGTGLDFVYHLNERGLRSAEDVARQESRRNQDFQNKSSSDSKHITSQIDSLVKENASLRTEQGNLMTYVSNAVTQVLENQNAIVGSFASFTTRHLELSSVDNDIQTDRLALSALRQNIAQDRFQVAMLRSTNPDPALIELLESRITAAEEEANDTKDRLDDSQQRRKGIQAQPTLVLPEIAQAVARPRITSAPITHAATASAPTLGPATATDAPGPAAKTGLPPPPSQASSSSATPSSAGPSRTGRSKLIPKPTYKGRKDPVPSPTKKPRKEATEDDEMLVDA